MLFIIRRVAQEEFTSFPPRGPYRSQGGRDVLALEKLEPRQLLAATDLAAITGRVFRDATGDGFTSGEQVVAATLNLYRDVNANGTLDSGDGGALRSATTDSNGQYRFDRLDGRRLLRPAAGAERCPAPAWSRSPAAGSRSAAPTPRARPA